MAFENWNETLKTAAPLHMSDVSDYLHESGRTETCPFCSYSGGWDFHVRLPEDGRDLEEDPLMTVYEIKNQHHPIPNECVAIACPQCAHFSLLDANRIKMHILRRDRLQGQNNG